jgi:hypothetical protein
MGFALRFFIHPHYEPTLQGFDYIPNVGKPSLHPGEAILHEIKQLGME